MPPVPDSLVQRAARGEHDAFAQIMRRYNQRLFRTARAILRDDAEAEDALQEAYVHAYRALPGFRGEAQLSTWLVRIVANEALGRLRTRQRGAQVIALGADADIAETQMDESQETQPDHAAERAQSLRLIEAKIDALPEAFRAVFVLRALEELSVEETAAALDIPAATVRTRYFRARALLREALAREFDLALQDAFGFAGVRCDRIVARVLARLASA
ncbi:MAG: RNA polymerase sigma factor [Betaproteobacteria bacterium]|nr:RNA polymerase sigma factor [Betaproteobacteria bacterium]